MATRDNMTLDVYCTGCEIKGEVCASESDHNFMGGPDFQITKHPSWLAVKKAGDTMEKTEIECAWCGSKAAWGVYPGTFWDIPEFLGTSPSDV